MTQWISNEPDKAQAFALADAGYDVWMGNNRGSAYSLAHASLETKSKEYWDFYQLEMGTVDVPTFMDFVLDKTGRSQLSYIGHSTGNNQFYMAASLHPDYFTQRVNVFISLAPPVFLKNVEAPIAYHYKTIQFVMEHVLHFYDLIYVGRRPSETLATVCSLPFLKPVCDKYIIQKMLIPEVDNMALSPLYLANFPSGSSYRESLYYA